MRKNVLRSITALLISLTVLLGSIPLSAAPADAETAPGQGEPAAELPVATDILVTMPNTDEPGNVPSAPQEGIPGDGGIPGLPVDPGAAGDLPGDIGGDVPGDIGGDLPGDIGGDIGGLDPDGVTDTERPMFAVQWDNLPMYSGYIGVYQWSIVLENGGYYIYAVTNMYESASFTITYDDGSEELLRYEASTQPTVLDSLWNTIPGAYVQSYVENNTRYAEIYLPQSFFDDILFTISCGQSVESFDITDSYGSPAMFDLMGGIMSGVTTLEEPAMGTLADEAESAFASSVCSGSNWAVVYKNGYYNLYLKGNQWSCGGGFYWMRSDYSGANIQVSNANNNETLYVNGLAVPRGNYINHSGTVYALYSIPESAIPSGSYFNGVLVEDIKSAGSGSGSDTGSESPDDPETPADGKSAIDSLATIQTGSNNGRYGVILKDDGYHFYLVNPNWENPGFRTVSTKDSSENWLNLGSPISTFEENGTAYREYVISKNSLPAEFDLYWATNNNSKINCESIEGYTKPSEDENPAADAPYPDIAKAVTTEIDWNNGIIRVVEKFDNNDSYSKWSIIKEGDSYCIVVMEKPTWNAPYLNIKYSDGTDDFISADINNKTVSSKWDNPAMGKESTLQTNVVDNVRYTEIRVPADTFRSKDFTINLNNGTSISSSEITDSNGVIPEPEPELNYPDVDSAITPHINWNSEGVAVHEVNSDNINKWSVVREGNYYYFLFNGSPYSLPSVKVTYNGDAQMCPGPITAGASSGALATGQGYVILDSDTNSANDKFNKSKYTEMRIPASFFESADFTLECGGFTISNSDITDVNGNYVAPYDYLLDNAATAPYTGISIDGNLSDWDGVPKSPIDDGNTNAITVEKTAVVWDGDYVYIYLTSRSPNMNAVCCAGSHGNGQYAITTDLGRMLLVQPTINESTGEIGIAGVDGAQIAVNKLPEAEKQTPYEWEIAIPTSQLPEYIDTISFGMYIPESDMQTPIHGVTNRQGTDTSGKIFNGIVIDGAYDDWKYYPHTLIQYATAGTGEHVVDANGALYNNGGQYIYGHAESVMPQHYTGDAWEVGKFNLSINDMVYDQNIDFQSRMVYEDPITHELTFDPQQIMQTQEYYQPYHYYIIDTSFNINPDTIHSLDDLRATGILYGDGYITRTPGSYDIEFEVDVEKLAAKAGMDPNDIKTINAQFIRLGDQWVTTAGTSTGAVFGLILCLATVSGTYFFKKRKTMGK